MTVLLLFATFGWLPVCVLGMAVKDILGGRTCQK